MPKVYTYYNGCHDEILSMLAGQMQSLTYSVGDMVCILSKTVYKNRTMKLSDLSPENVYLIRPSDTNNDKDISIVKIEYNKRIGFIIPIYFCDWQCSRLPLTYWHSLFDDIYFYFKLYTCDMYNANRTSCEDKDMLCLSYVNMKGGMYTGIYKRFVYMREEYLVFIHFDVEEYAIYTLEYIKAMLCKPVICSFQKVTFNGVSAVALCIDCKLQSIHDTR